MCLTPAASGDMGGSLVGKDRTFGCQHQPDGYAEWMQWTLVPAEPIWVTNTHAIPG